MSVQKVKFFGRKKGKKISSLQKSYLDQFLPKILISKTHSDENIGSQSLDLKEIFSSDKSIWLEVGFGGGEHLLELAKENPEINFVGCEPYINGVAMLLPKLFDANLSNIRIFMDDARLLLQALPERSIERLFLLFPDPWPKNRHVQRRFINPETIKNLKKVLQKGAIVKIATDVDLYVEHVLKNFFKHKEFEWMAEEAKDWRIPWESWRPTRYYKKGIMSGKKITYLMFKFM